MPQWLVVVSAKEFDFTYFHVSVDICICLQQQSPGVLFSSPNFDYYNEAFRNNCFAYSVFRDL